MPDGDKEKQDMFLDLCKQVVTLSWPLIDKESIQEVFKSEATGDGQYQDDTIIYWDNDEIFEETLPYHDDSDDDFVDEPATVDQDSGDSVYQYSRCMLWRGLLHMAQTHAERTNNGDHIISDWRMVMVQFWNYNHYKYLILGHRLLAANLRNSHGQYTDVQVSRCSHLVGSVGKSIEDIFQSEIVQDFIPRPTTSDGSSRPKMKKFIDEYSEEILFKDIGEGHHTGFENFEHKIGVKNPEKLKTRIQKYGKALEN